MPWRTFLLAILAGLAAACGADAQSGTLPQDREIEISCPDLIYGLQYDEPKTTCDHPDGHLPVERCNSLRIEGDCSAFLCAYFADVNAPPTELQMGPIVDYADHVAGATQERYLDMMVADGVVVRCHVPKFGAHAL